MKKALSLLLMFSLIWCAFVFTVNAENEEAVKEILFTPNTTLTVTSGSSCVLSEQGYLHITSNAGGTQHVQISLEGINVSEYPYIVFNYRYTTGSDYNGGVEVVSNGGVYSGIGGNLLTDGKWHTRMLYLPSLISGLDSSYSASYFILPVPNEAGKTVDISALAFCKTAEDAEDSAGNIVPLNETYGVYLPNPNNIIGIQTSAIYNEENGYLTVTRTEGDKNNDAHIAFAIDVNPSETPYIVFKYRLNDNDYSDSFSHLATNGSNYADFNYATPLKADGEWHTSVYYIPTCFPTVIYEHINGFMLPAPWNNGGTLDIEYIRFFENVESVEAFIGECDHCDAVNGVCSCGWTEPARITNIDGKEFYKIANAGNLIDFGNMIATSWLGKELNGILVADIDLSSVCSEESGKSWTPIVSNGSRGWRGTFDGNGHTISNLYIYNPDGSRLGLFTELVRTDNLNPIIENLIITGIVIGGSSTGGICGANDGGIIRNCISLVHATGTKTTSSVGAICGYTDSGKVQNCFYMYGEVGYQGVNYEFGANGEAGTVSDVYKKTEEEFASGEVAYMLNGSADAGAWKQIIGTDALPYIAAAILNP